jgi:hypothetical protein|tara:strand:+ start:809 stop:1003 length:195 start_codon:yes stop_codon:yes gene_type:complete
MKNNKLNFIVFYLFIFQNLFAYLDPGTWGYALQLLMMVFVGGIVAIKTFWQNIKSFLYKIFNKK